MDYLLFVVVVLLIWILTLLLKSEETVNPCTQGKADESETLIESIPEEKEAIPCDDETNTEIQEVEDTDKNVVCSDDFLSYDKCVSEDPCEIRCAEIMSRGSLDVIPEQDNDVAVTPLFDDGQASEVFLKNEDDLSDLNSSTDNYENKISQGEKAETTLVPGSIGEFVENEKGLNDDVGTESEVGIKDASDPVELDASEAKEYNDGSRVINTAVDLINKNVHGSIEAENLGISAEAEIFQNSDINVEEVKHTATDIVSDCSSKSEWNKHVLPNVDVEVEVDVRQAKVYIVPDVESSTTKSVVSLTFSKNEADSPTLVVNSEEAIEHPQVSSSVDHENKPIGLESIDEEDKVFPNKEEENPTEVEEIVTVYTEDKAEESSPAYYVTEPNCTELILHRNNEQERKYADEMDRLKGQQIQAYVDNIQNLTNEIQITEMKQVGFIQRKLEFTEISDEEEILYRNITKRGEEEFTEEIQTKNEVSSSIVTSENISIDPNIATSTTITKIINMSYTTEECTTENIELKSIDQNYLTNDEKINVPSIQEYNGEENERVGEAPNNFSSQDLTESVNSLEGSIAANNNENTSLCPIESDASLPLKKKPACGVFLFGGEELLSKIKTRRVIVDKYENEEKRSSVENDDSWRLSTTNKGVMAYKEQVTTNTTTSQTKKSNQRTHTLQETMKQTLSVSQSQKPDAAFGLSTHLSIGSRTEDTKWISSADEPFDINTMTSHKETSLTELISDMPQFETETLIHLNKDRAKGPLRRRKPERAN